MRIQHIIDWLDKEFPEHFSAVWDTTQGLVRGSPQTEVRTVVLTLELGPNAPPDDADLVITHHPPIFGPDRQVTNPYYGKTGIPVYAIHSRLDRCGFTSSAMAREVFGQRDIEVLDDGTALVEAAMSSDELVRLVKGKFTVRCLPVIKKKDMVSKVAFHGGEGFNAHHVDLAIKHGADAYIAGDLTHHTAEHAHFFDANFYDVGHGAEQVAMKELALLLKKGFPDIKFVFVKQPPWWTNDCQ